MFIYSPEGIGVSVTCTKPGPPFWPRQGSLKAFDWLQREAGSRDWRRWACWYNCRLSERGGSEGGLVGMFCTGWGASQRGPFRSVGEENDKSGGEGLSGGRRVWRLEHLCLCRRGSGRFLRSRSKQQLNTERNKGGRAPRWLAARQTFPN